jgi:hypothetical protein
LKNPQFDHPQSARLVGVAACESQSDSGSPWLPAVYPF